MTKKDCIGCQDNFYNGDNSLGVSECWRFKEAKIIWRKRVRIDQVPPWNQKTIRKPDCYREPRYVFVKPDQVR